MTYFSRVFSSAIKTRALLTLLLIVMGSSLQAQINLTRNGDVPVSNGFSQLQYPWTGGLNAPQFSQQDLNFDGLPDYFVFDRYSDLAFVFLKTEEGYIHDVSYNQYLPPLTSWALMRDYNCDDIPDIFFSTMKDNLAGIGIYEGRQVGNHLEFSLAIDFLTFDDDQPLIVSVFDLPDINDIDNDGDIDILTFQTPSGGFVEYFENTSTDCQKSISFSRVDECWGNVYESGISTSLKLDTICDSGDGFISNFPIDRHSQMHPGSTLLSFDQNNDNLRELILGDISFDNLVMLVNGGTTQDAFIVSQDTLFPFNNIPAILQSFPAAYSVDANDDGLLDLLVSPNSGAQLETRENIWYYENTGSADQAVFERQNTRYLSDQTIDVGRFAQPALADVDGDGLQDLIIGHYTPSSGSDEPSGLYLYKNTGTSTEPAFTFETDDFLNLRNLLGLPGLFAPNFGDIDSDGDIDMMLGIGDTDYNGQLILFENDAEPGDPPNFTYTPFNINYANIDVGQFSIPQMIDADRDGLTDILVGSKNQGRLFFYKNIGAVGAPEFDEGTNYWGEVILVADGLPEGHSAPALADLDGSGNYSLLVGTREGPLYVFTDIEDNVASGAFTLNGAKQLDLGERIVPCIGELDGDPTPELIIGTERGGVVFYDVESLWPTNLDHPAANENVQIWPSPAAQLININLPSSDFKEIEIYKTSGQLIYQDRLHQGKIHQIKTEDWPNGVYHIKLTNRSTSITKKIIIQK